ncbi:hypothetical protein ES702_00391 [subsurface metagenome]
MASIVGALRGGWFPEDWSAPVALGLGVVITGFLGDTVAGFLSGFVPSEWMNPASELLVGVLLFILGGFIGGDMSMWLRLFSLGAFAVGIADAVSIVLGLVTPAVAVRAVAPTVTTIPSSATRRTVVSTQRYQTTNRSAAGRFALT